MLLMTFNIRKKKINSADLEKGIITGYELCGSDLISADNLLDLKKKLEIRKTEMANQTSGVKFIMTDLRIIHV